MVKHVPDEDKVETRFRQVQPAFPGEYESDVTQPRLLCLAPDEIQVLLLDINC